MPRFSVCVEILLDAENEQSAVERALEMAKVGILMVEGTQSSVTIVPQAGTGDVVNLDLLDENSAYFNYYK